MYSTNSFFYVWPDIYVPKKDLLEVEELETYALKNAENHRTEKYELVRNSQLPVLRRSAKFFLGVRAGNRVVDFSKDDIRVVFLFGKLTASVYVLYERKT